MGKKISFKKFLLIWLFTTSFYSLISIPSFGFTLSSQTSKAIASTKTIETNPNKPNNQSFLLTKKSGGRSGGGSFKRSKPSRTKTRTTKRTRSSSPSRTYRSPHRSSNSSYNRSRRNSSGRPISSGGNRLMMPVVLGFIAIVIIFIVLINSGVIQNQAVTSSKNTKSGYDKERDNDRVTVSMLQVVLNSFAAVNIKEELNQLSIETDTSSNEGLVKLMQETVLLLLRNEEAWNYVLSSSKSLHINEAESAFDSLSLVERSKFSSETLNNVDGKLQTVDSNHSGADGEQVYLVVTLIAGTADDNPLFEKIYSTQSLKDALMKIAVMRDDYLMKFELLWTPQQHNEYLTEDELLTEYSSLILLS